MEQYLPTFVGVAVSVVLSVVGYRQTIGAKKERIRAANSDLERIVLRCIMLDRDLPEESDISRLIKGKSIDHRVRPSDLISVTQLLNVVYTRIVESDLIDSVRRQEILSSITPILVASENRPILEGDFEELDRSDLRRNKARVLVLTMGIVLSIIGGLISVVIGDPSLLDDSSTLAEDIVFPALSSLAAISAVYIAMRLRSFQEETVNGAGELSSYVAFEDQVRKTLTRLGELEGHASSGDDFDFLIRRGDRRFVIEAKTWSTPVPVPVILSTIKRLQKAAQSFGADEAIIVTLGSAHGRHEIAEKESIRMFTLKELKKYLGRIPI